MPPCPPQGQARLCLAPEHPLCLHTINLISSNDLVSVIRSNIEGYLAVQAEPLLIKAIMEQYLILIFTWSFSAVWIKISFLATWSRERVVTTSLWSQSSTSSGLGTPSRNLFLVIFLLQVEYPTTDFALMPVSKPISQCSSGV